MTNEKETQMAALIAVEILDRADEGTKLFTLNQHYPSKGKAISYGFHVTLGAIFAVCFSLTVGRIATAAFNAVFP